MTGTGPWTCPACNLPVSTPFCPQCGERPPQPGELTLRGVIGQALHAFTNLDARLLRTLRALVARPGVLTQLYLRGPRKPFVGPFALFLLANVGFVAMESLSNSFVFSPPLANHLQRQPWSEFARDLVARRLASAHTTLADYAPVFDAAVETNARTFIIVMVPPFAVAAALLFFRRRPPFVANLVFALHFHAFMLLLFSAALAIPTLDLLIGGPGLASQRLDDVISVGLLAGATFYLYRAIGPAYAARGPSRVLQAIALGLAAMVVVLGYRFALFLATLLATT